MTDSTDSQASADLVTAARAGDHAAFASLIQRHDPMVHALCTRALGDADLGRDAAPEAAVTAMLGLARLRRDDRFGAWPAGIALNLCRRLLQDRDWAAFSLDALLEDHLISEPSGTDPDPAEAITAAEVTRRIKDAVSALPPGQRQATEAYNLSGLTTPRPPTADTDDATRSAHPDETVGPDSAPIPQAKRSFRRCGARPRSC